jgi:hypothetical protein
MVGIPEKVLHMAIDSPEKGDMVPLRRTVLYQVMVKTNISKTG